MKERFFKECVEACLAVGAASATVARIATRRSARVRCILVRGRMVTSGKFSASCFECRLKSSEENVTNESERLSQCSQSLSDSEATTHCAKSKKGKSTKQKREQAWTTERGRRGSRSFLMRAICTYTLPQSGTSLLPNTLNTRFAYPQWISCLLFRTKNQN